MEALVISSTEGGFRVYSVQDPRTSYLVSGTWQKPHCTCAEFATRSNSTFCAHVAVVCRELHGSAYAFDPAEIEERRAIQNEDRETAPPMIPPYAKAEMLIKRSVSPDGRIDALSVEFSCPVDETSTTEIQTKAQKILTMQSAIVDRFLNRPANGNGAPKPNGAENGNGHVVSSGVSGESTAVPARMVSIGGMDGRWGRRLYLIFDVEGHNLRLFGNKKEIVDAIATAGFVAPKEIGEGLQLNIPCHVTLKPSADGKYTNVERVVSSPTARPHLQRRAS